MVIVQNAIRLHRITIMLFSAKIFQPKNSVTVEITLQQ